MSKFINPFTDVGFKRIFGQEMSKDLLIDFLNCLFDGERHIEDVTFLDKEQLPDNARDRGLIYDVYCQTATGEHIIVEMQNKDQLRFKERALLYLSKAIVGQSHRGKDGDSYEIDAVYGIFFMNFHNSRFERKFRTDVALMDMDTHEVFSDKIRMIYMQLPEFQKKEQECESLFDRWIFLLKNMSVLERLPWESQHRLFRKLSQICETAALTADEFRRYEESIRIYRDNMAIASKEHSDGLAEGLAKGRAEGLAEGLAQGIAQGIAQGQNEKSLEIAKRMRADGLSDELIEKYTGLAVRNSN